MPRLAFVGLATILASASVAQFPGHSAPEGPWRRGYESIKPAEAKRILSYLAGPECEGRGSGQIGYQRAAEYVAKRFRDAGLQPGGDDGTYFQNGTLYRSRVLSGRLTVAGRTMNVGNDFELGKLYANIDRDAEIVAVRVRDKRSDLPPGTDLKGKIVLLSGPGVDASIRLDIRNQDPAAILNVKKDTPKSVDTVTRRKPSEPRVQGTISEGAVDRIADWSGFTGRAYGDKFLYRPVEVSALGPAHLEAKVEAGEVKVPNVVGVLPGSDPVLKSQVVGLGAHLDHLGTDGNTIYYGADDDGSGSTALLLIAKAMGREAPAPKRTIVFMAFYGEEMGLLGSQFYAANPKFPLKDMVAHLQMDMVGRDSYGPQNGDSRRIDKLEENLDTMRLVGSRRISTELHDIIQRQNEYVGFRFKYDSEDVYTRSDHYSFASKGVPIAFLFDGFTPDYHQPTDTVDKINWNKIANTAKLFFLTAEDLANRPNPPVKDVKQAD